MVSRSNSPRSAEISLLQRLAATLVVLLTIGACGGPDSGQIEGRWLLDSAAADGVFLVLDPGLSAYNDLHVPAWFEFDSGGEFEGSGPCNDISGRYDFDGISLIAHDSFHTLSACIAGESPVVDFMSLEALVFDSLASSEVHFSTDMRMQWQTDRVTLTFRRQT